MSVKTILKSRWTGTPAIGLLALSVAILAALLLPGRAEAQQEQATNKTTVVGAGDSLWAIAQARLTPDASPQQIAAKTEQIYVLNRDRIGDDPNFILVGQEIIIEPEADPMVASEEPRANDEEPAAASDRARVSSAPAATPTERAAPETAPSAEQSAEVEVPAGATAEGDEENAAEEDPAPSEPEGIGGVIAGERQLLGLAILLLTWSPVVVAILIAWSRSMNRPGRGLGPYHEYYDNHALPRELDQEQTEKEGEEQTTEVEATTAATSADLARKGQAGSRQQRLRRIHVNRKPRGR